MKRILLVIDSLVEGGAQRQFVGLSSLLKDRGYDVSVAYYLEHTFYKDVLESHNVPYSLLPVDKNKVLRYPSIYRQLKKIVRSFQPDIVISYLRIPSILCSILHCWDKGFRLIVSERNTTQKLDILEKIKFFTFRWSDAIVSNSYSQADFVKLNYPGLSFKTFVITNFVDTDYFFPADEKVDNDKLTIMVAGRLAPQKNVLAFIEAVKRVRLKGYEFNVDWYGKSYDDYSFDCIQKVRNENLEDCIKFHPAVKDIRSAYSKADVFCLPSLYEGFPNVICEAMSCGLPLVCSNVCDNPRIVDSSCGVLFNPMDVNDMVTKLESMLNLSVKERHAMGRRSRAKSELMFSSTEFVNKYIELF